MEKTYVVLGKKDKLLAAFPHKHEAYAYLQGKVGAIKVLPAYL